MQILRPTQTWGLESLGQGPAGCVVGSPCGSDACSRARTSLGSGTRSLGIWSQKHGMQTWHLCGLERSLNFLVRKMDWCS